MRSEAEIDSAVLEKAYKLEAETARLKAELDQAKHREQQIREHEFQRGYDEAEAAHAAREARLREALDSIKKIRFLLGNDPKLRPAYEMGDIAQHALAETATPQETPSCRSISPS